jgi:hypothetical protein
MRLILDGAHAALCCPDTALRDHTGAAHREGALSLCLTDQQIRITVLSSMFFGVAETEQAVPVLSIDAEGGDFDLALEQGVDELVTCEVPLPR